MANTSLVLQKADLEIAVIGGAGHVGLPLSLLLVKAGFRVHIIDIDERRLALLQAGVFPFVEEGGEELLHECLHLPLEFHSDYGPVHQCDVIIMTVGTPVDEHLNPNLGPFHQAVEQLEPHLHNGQTIILRSTLFPGTSERLQQLLTGSGLDVGVSFCPERTTQGKALTELRDLPQIVSGGNEWSTAVARRVFGAIARDIVELPMKEAELSKLYANSWRYIKFAVANQFYMIATENGLDFDRIRNAMIYNYSRAADFPSAGFAAGPCLFKDTMQLASYNRHNFGIGHAAMLINETLPNFLVDQVKKRRTLAGQTVGILGMAFKPDNDDKRESLAYKLRKLLVQEGATVLCTDVFIRDPDFLPLHDVLACCEIIFVGCPHSAYSGIDFNGKDVIDCWGRIAGGVRCSSVSAAAGLG